VGFTGVAALVVACASSRLGPDTLTGLDRLCLYRHRHTVDAFLGQMQIWALHAVNVHVPFWRDFFQETITDAATAATFSVSEADCLSQLGRISACDLAVYPLASWPYIHLIAIGPYIDCSVAMECSPSHAHVAVGAVAAVCSVAQRRVASLKDVTITRMGRSGEKGTHTHTHTRARARRLSHSHSRVAV
jgi:hypothetical protein